MSFSFDYYDNLRQSKIFLANPQKQKKYVGMLSGIENENLSLKFNSLHELTFNIHEYKNGEYTEFYDKIVKMRLIELQYIGWFQIVSAVEKQDGNSKERYKEVKCLSLENELVYKKVYNVSGVYELYNPLERDKSLLSIMLENTGWKVGHIDNDLLVKYRTFDITSDHVYSLLTTVLSKSFECVFTFDTYTRTVNCYELANMGELTNIVVSRQNILKEYIKEDSESSIITKLRVSGGDELDIRAVNPTGNNYLINLDYFMSEEWGFSQDDINAWNTYKIKVDSVTSNYSSTLSELKTKQSELLTLQTELTDLEGLKSVQDRIVGVSVETHGSVPHPTDSDYTIYQSALSSIALYNTQIANKKADIKLKETEVSSIDGSLSNISEDLDWNNNFTQEQIAQLNLFLTEDQDYEDSTFIVTDETTEVEGIDIRLELMEYADNELVRASQPQYTYNTTTDNLFTICDDKDGIVSYDEWRGQFSLGNLICIKFRSDYNTIARLMQININFDSPEDLGLVFSDKSRLDDSFTQLAEIIASSGKSSSSYSLSKMGYDKAKNQTNKVREFINGSLNATLNAVKNNDNQEVLLDEWGLRGRKWLPDQNKYDDNQLWLNNQNIMISSDGFKSSQTAFGKLTLESGETAYGLIGDVIIGRLLMSEKLFIDNASGNFTINDDGFTASATVGGDTYSVGINPSTPTDIINVKVNGSHLLYLDTNTRRLTLQDASIKASSFIGGSIESENYTIDSNDINHPLLGTKIDLTNGNIYSKNFSIVSGDAYFKGHIEAESGTIAGFDIVPKDDITHNGGFIYEDRINNKYIRISPYSYHEGGGIYNTDYGAIDLGNIDSNGVVKTLATLRGNGYVRFGLVSEGGVSVRFNDFLRYNEGVFGATDTVMYTQNFWIDTDGTVHIKSDDVTKPISIIEKTIDENNRITKLDITYEDDTTAIIDIKYDVNGEITKMGDTIIM